jgi:hypothetical protein
MENIRGIFNNLLSNEFKSNKKIMSIELLESKCVSFDLIFSDDSYNEQIKNIIKEKDFEYTNYSDRESIYFICIKNKTEIKRITKNNTIIISVYKNEHRILRKIKIKFENVLKCFGLDNDLKLSYYNKSKIILSGKMDYTLYLYDIIDKLNIDIRIYSKIVYIGRTDFPFDRPFDKSHKGMMRAIYNYKNKGNDIFIYYNFFHIRYCLSENRDINFCMSNSLDEIIDKKIEASLIEKILIKYFLSEDYSNNYKNEIGELKNILKFLNKDHNIIKIFFRLAYNNEYYFYKYYSDKINIRSEHNFVINCENMEIKES